MNGVLSKVGRPLLQVTAHNLAAAPICTFVIYHVHSLTTAVLINWHINNVPHYGWVFVKAALEARRHKDFSRHKGSA